MSKTKSKIADVLISRFSKKGFGIGDIPVADGTETRKVEIAHALVGDQVRIELRGKRKGARKGRLLKVLTPSLYRVTPHCEHAEICGGCLWQSMSYEEQIKQKEKSVREAFASILPTQKALFFPMVPCDHPWQYRNKMEFSFSENRAGNRFLGLMIAHSGSYVFNVRHCHLASGWFSKVLSNVRQWWEKTDIKAYDLSCDTGSLQTLTLREGKRTGEKMVTLTVSAHTDYSLTASQLQSFQKAVIEAAGDISLFIRLKKIAKKTPTQWFEEHLYGNGCIHEELHLSLFSKKFQYKFKISPTSFFQPNTFQAEKLYQNAIELLSLTEEDVVYDLYCGTATLGMAVSPFVRKVIGIELNEDAVEDAKKNLSLNGISNVEMHAGDVGKVITGLMGTKDFTPPNLVIVDPPRAGLDSLATHHLKILRPKAILYISCNPHTQAENIFELMQAGYQVKKVQPVDQFPHTYHIENIAYLELT